MPLITSANIACGGHAGGVLASLEALRLARQSGVQVGAHPGYLDREQFGRRDLDWPEAVVEQVVSYQLEVLLGLASVAGVSVRYVKPHGALYNQACRCDAVARPVV